MKEVIDFINLEICERRNYSASKAFEIARDKIIEYMKKSKHGGAREGSGRPKLKKSQKKEPTKVVRVPLSKLKAVLKIIHEQ